MWPIDYVKNFNNQIGRIGKRYQNPNLGKIAKRSFSPFQSFQAQPQSQPHPRPALSLCRHFAPCHDIADDHDGDNNDDDDHDDDNAVTDLVHCITPRAGSPELQPLPSLPASLTEQI